MKNVFGRHLQDQRIPLLEGLRVRIEETNAPDRLPVRSIQGNAQKGTDIRRPLDRGTPLQFRFLVDIVKNERRIRSGRTFHEGSVPFCLDRIMAKDSPDPFCFLLKKSEESDGHSENGRRQRYCSFQTFPRMGVHGIDPYLNALLLTIGRIDRSRTLTFFFHPLVLGFPEEALLTQLPNHT